MKVLLAIDDSPYSHIAIREVADHPWPDTTEVRLITVDAPLGQPTFGTPGVTAYDEFVHQQRALCSDSLVKGADLLRELAPQLKISAALLEGSPKEQILDECRRWGADLVVVGSQGRGAIKSLVLGSVSLGVVMGAPCSVLVVREAAPAAKP